MVVGNAGICIPTALSGMFEFTQWSLAAGSRARPLGWLPHSLQHHQRTPVPDETIRTCRQYHHTSDELSPICCSSYALHDAAKLACSQAGKDAGRTINAQEILPWGAQHAEQRGARCKVASERTTQQAAAGAPWPGLQRQRPHPRSERCPQPESALRASGRRKRAWT